MMKKFKKISAVLASVLVISSGMTAINSNAIYCAVNAFKYPDKYLEMLDEFNGYSQYTNYPELCQTIDELYFRSEAQQFFYYPGELGRVDNIWLSPFSDGSNYYDFIIDYKRSDYMYIKVDVSDKEGVTSESLLQEINENVELSEETNSITTEYYKEYENDEYVPNPDKIVVRLNFSSENHDANYQDCQNVVSFLKENNYKLEMAEASIDVHEIKKGRIGCHVSEIIKDEKLAESINESLKSNGLNAHLDTVKYKYSGEVYEIFFDDENLTVTEKFEICNFIKQNYGLDFYAYLLADGTLPQTIDLLAITGDADCDGKVNINDAVFVMQSIANPDKYQLSEQGKANADIDGNGITLSDAVTIQEMAASHLYD